MFALFLKNRTKQKTKTFLNYFKLNIVVSPKRCNFTHIFNLNNKKMYFYTYKI